MTDYQKYAFILCVIVFGVLTLLSVIVVATFMKLSVRLINCGEQDEDIIEEYTEKYTKYKGKNRKGGYWGNIVISLLFLMLFGFSMYINTQAASVSDTIPTLRVVRSSSMSDAYEGNTYLQENDLTNQFDLHDLVLTYKLPDEFDLELYDVVVYEVDGSLIIHRIVGIEEPNEKHPDERHFLLQGDGVERPDRFPVRYEQMRGIYRNQRVRFVGSFITFMQSFAGWLCIGLIVGASLVAPLLDGHLEKKRKIRLAKMLYPYTEEDVLWEYVEEYRKRR